MEEKELIAKLRELRQIKPNKEWAVLTKERILGEEEKYQNPVSVVLSTFRIIFAKPAYAGLTAIFLFAGLFGTLTFAQNSLPGDKLYLMKKIAEKVEVAFVSEEELPIAQLGLTNKRLEELAKVAKENRVRNLPSAISETRASISEANKNLAKASSPTEIKKIVDQIEEKAQTISQTLGVAFGEEELEELKENSDKLYLSSLISSLEISTLTEKQKEILVQMKELVKEEKYSETLTLFYVEFNKAADVELEGETEELEESTTSVETTEGEGEAVVEENEGEELEE